MSAPHPWAYTPVSPKLFGDEGPWTWYVPTLWRALGDPEGPWEPPAKPWARHWADEEQLGQRIAYWAPLMTLVYGVLGWARPELGVQRWVDQGRPTDSAALTVLDRWWGDDALVLRAWAPVDGGHDHLVETVAARTGSAPVPVCTLGQPRIKPEWGHIGPGGGDDMHLGHFLDQFFGNPSLRTNEAEPTLIRASTTNPGAEASLILPAYAGWYGNLSRLGAQLPERPDGRSWRVHVTAMPVGYLGEYRRSRVTGRWFTGRHRWHELGWPD